jgi:methylenetetrahydrofolate dehydrogenase (NADP+)/methenyltetrahydrofolate cyclohydrolase
MVILCIGDVFAAPGREVVARLLPELIRRHRIDFVVANGENLAHGAGITPSTAEKLFAAGVDVITGGNHTWDRSEGWELIRTDPRVLRPANYPADAGGRGHGIFRARNGRLVGVLNLQGRVFMPDTDDPFRAAAGLLGEMAEQTPILVVDLHAEATSEKLAMAWHLSGRASVLVGTHTHVATADARVFEGGTAFVTDVGMTGSHAGVIGVDRRAALDRFVSGMPRRLEPAEGRHRLSGLLAEVDDDTGRATAARLLDLDADAERARPPCRILAGAPVAELVQERAAARAARLRAAGVEPMLALLSVGDDPASQVYLARKNALAARAGLSVRRLSWEAGARQEEVALALDELGRDGTVHGILLQLPLPRGFDTAALLERIAPEKDVDGFHPVNAGRLAMGVPGFVPCTPLGVREMLRHYDIPIAGKRVVIVGRSLVVGRPLATLLSNKGQDAIVTVVHSRTPDAAAIAREADVLVAAAGQPCLVVAEWVRPGAAVIDVGIHRIPDPSSKSGTRLVGDVDAEAVTPIAGALSPVPGGVGPLTVAFLLDNAVTAAERAAERSVSATVRRGA